MSQEWMGPYKSWIFPVGFVGSPRADCYRANLPLHPIVTPVPLLYESAGCSHLVLLCNVIHHEM